MSSRPGRPLKGIRILDLTQALSGPYASQLLSDLGADVVKVESADYPDNTRTVHPLIEPNVSHYFPAINHDKRSLELDLKSKAGLEALLRLAEKADVIISNYRAGALDALGLTTQVLEARNPRLIQCLISGFGQTPSDYRRKAVYDANIQALTGFMSITADAESGPLRCGVSIGDVIPGTFAVQSICAALFEREKTGKGQVLDVAMYDCMFSALSYYLTLTQATGESPQPSGAAHASVTPMGRFPVKDGWIVISAFTEVFWKKLCNALERPDIAIDPRFCTLKDRLAHRDELTALLTAIFKTRTRDEWADILERHDVPNSPVLDVQDAMNHPIVEQRRLLRPQQLPSGRSINVARYPVVFGSELPDVEPTVPAALLGAHSLEVMREWLDDDPAYVEMLRSSKVLDVG